MASPILAWVLTYLRHVRPFTAHCRILTPALVRLCDYTTRSGAGLDLGSADVGLIVAEGVAYSVGRNDLELLCRSGRASALCRLRSLKVPDGMGAKSRQAMVLLKQ